MVTRRRLLQLGAALAAAPVVLKSRAAEPLRISAFGGFFERTLGESVIKKFTAETGIPVQTVSQGAGDDWLFGLVRATRANLAPVDLTLLTEVGLIRMMNMGNVLQPINADILPNARRVPQKYVFRHQDRVYGVAAVSWYQSLAINPDAVPEPPTSWKDILEDEKYQGKLGLNGNYDGGLLEIVASTYFDGNSTLATNEGIEAVMGKIAELKPRTRIWWTAESQMEQALRNQEVIAGTYYHDVANLLQQDGFPIRSIFPREGAFIGVGRYALLSTSKQVDAAHAFINFCTRPDVQSLFARAMGLAPVLPQTDLDLSEDEFAAVATRISPILPASEVMVNKASYLQRRWQRMITA